jgi:pyridoxal phosphate enzyme (YggS family)
MDIESNLAQIQRNIEAACSRSGRNPSEILLLPVSKGHSAHEVRAAADLGLNIFGENKVQEAKVKISQCPGRLRWHMIGHLQSNKCRDAVQFFQMIESVDTLDLASELNKSAEKSAKHIPILLEVNVAGEGTKFGFKPDNLIESIDSINSLSRLEIHGLMTIAPYSNDSEKVRPVFKRLRELKDQCSQKLGAPLPHLSMGMSGDYQVAIEEGATIIRIGTALFGPRVYQKRAASEDSI